MNQFIVFFLAGITGVLSVRKETGSIPYHVSIEKFGKHFCSGAIISEDVILTTASCIFRPLDLDVKVRVGSNQLESDGAIKSVKKITLHKRFVPTRKDYDIALIQLKENLTFSDNIQPIALAGNSAIPPEPGKLGLLTGFGLTNVRDQYCEELRQVDVDITVPITCKNGFAPLLIFFTERMFCAELLVTQSCPGHSGSPLVINNELVGIQSWLQKSGSPKFPGIYTNIASLREWIKNEEDL